MRFVVVDLVVELSRSGERSFSPARQQRRYGRRSFPAPAGAAPSGYCRKISDASMSEVREMSPAVPRGAHKRSERVTSDVRNRVVTRGCDRREPVTVKRGIQSRAFWSGRKFCVRSCHLFGLAGRRLISVR